MKLGFVEGYVGEHGTDPEENITSSAMFLATLVDATRTMKLDTGTINIPNHYPAARAATRPTRMVRTSTTTAR